MNSDLPYYTSSEQLKLFMLDIKKANPLWGIDKRPGARKLNARLKSSPDILTPLIVTLVVEPLPCETETLVALLSPPLPETRFFNSSILYGLPPQQELIGVILDVSTPPVLNAMAALTMSAISWGLSHGFVLPHLSELVLYPCVYHAL